MFRFEDAKISKVIETGEKVTCLLDRYAVCKVKKGFSVDDTVMFEVCDTVICTYDIGDKIEVAYFEDFQKIKMTDFLTEDIFTPYPKHSVTCDSMETFREIFEPLDNETEAFEAFLSEVKKHRVELSEAKLSLDKAEAHYNKIAAVRQILTALVMLSIAIMGVFAIDKIMPALSTAEQVYKNAFLLITSTIIGFMGFMGIFVGLLLCIRDPFNCFTVRHQPMIEKAEKLYNAEVENRCLELTNLKTRLL